MALQTRRQHRFVLQQRTSSISEWMVILVPIHHFQIRMIGFLTASIREPESELSELLRQQHVRHCKSVLPISARCFKTQPVQSEEITLISNGCLFLLTPC